MAKTYDVITIGGGLAGAALAKRLAENGALVLEREIAFRDRVRGEQMHSWGVAEARTLGLYQLLLETCGHEVRYWSDQLVGFSEFGRRDLVKTSPHRAGSLNFYHPDMQSVVIGAAAAAGATVRRGARVVELVSDGLLGVRVHEDGNGERVYRARLVVGADGRNSVCRRWGGFHVERDSEGMVIAGVLMEGLAAPEDRMSASLNPRLSMLSLTVPLGGGRFRAYVSIHKDARESTAAPLSGEANIPAFVAASIAAGAPAKWYEGARAAGPLASYDARDTWVSHPHRAGLVLIGDAAASNDPSWGCGLSLTLRDVRVLADKLLASEDWSGAADGYAEEHDRHYSVIHRLTGWARALFYHPSLVAAAVRESALTRLVADRTRGLDIVGIGPDFLAMKPRAAASSERIERAAQATRCCSRHKLNSILKFDKMPPPAMDVIWWGCRLMALFGSAAMSAVRSLTGGRRTWRGQPISVANDPMYGPAVRCKWFRRAGGERSCINVSGL